MSDVQAHLTPEEIQKLRAILRGLSATEWRALKALAMGIVNGMGGGQSAAAPSNGAGQSVATDAELDGRFGNPTVRKDARRWAGESYIGATYSECPSDYLLVLAEQFEWSAGKDKENPEAKKHRNGTPFWKYNLADAARARGWARRNKGKTLPPPGATSAQPASDDSGPVDEGAPVDYSSNDANEDWVPT
jgi:hypothetical protein